MLHLPTVPDSFYWTHEPWGAAIRCRPLEAVAPHLFTTRQPQLSGNLLRQLAAAVGADTVATVKQVHGAAVLKVSGGWTRPADRSEADVLVSNDPTVAVAVRVADCVPVLLADRKTAAVSAVHAGWRGTAARAVVAAVQALTRECGTRPEDLIAAIGPSIGPCCYEVGSELVDAFVAAGHERSSIDRWFTTTPSPRGSFGGSPSAKSGPLRLDLPGANRDQLVVAGVPESHIHLSGLCTAMHLDVFTSYRVEKENAGRLLGVINARA
jgi:YfiH family protein